MLIGTDSHKQSGSTGSVHQLRKSGGDFENLKLEAHGLVNRLLPIAPRLSVRVVSQNLKAHSMAPSSTQFAYKDQINQDIDASKSIEQRAREEPGGGSPGRVWAATCMDINESNCEEHQGNFFMMAYGRPYESQSKSSASA
ncbi:hypothetical protein K466DRAFT_565992 [Polyporus arcularius HHB13444]|uniref:Uncharacterized protein n=1 Tax=Polyporus arcularius HHB13444 TaxID=1314778 RepID=A0A5C3P9R4_9APHY|nr:hypothetical protein K466DRAFT_565992 [Polyporus arcularius HHB13444]